MPVHVLNKTARDQVYQQTLAAVLADIAENG